MVELSQYLKCFCVQRGGIGLFGLPFISPQIGWFEQQELFSHSSRSEKFNIMLSAGLVPPEASVLSWQVATILLLLHMVVPLFTCTPISLSHLTGHITLGAHLNGLTLTQSPL